MKRRTIPSPGSEHRRQLIWQVWAPLGGSILIVLFLAGLSIAGAVVNSDQIERWGNISTVWIIIPGLIAAFILLAMLLACVYGMSKLLVSAHRGMLQLLSRVERIGQILRKVADFFTRPVIATNETQARVKTLWKVIFQSSTRVARETEDKT
jgi:hypothetical protein